MKIVSSSAANPYLLTAGCIIAGIDSIQRNLQPKKRPFGGNTHLRPVPNTAERVPSSLREALEGLNNDALFKDQLGEQFVRAFTQIKNDEIRTAEKQEDQ